ncbi:Mitochondrial matrix cochaperone [Tulasnella sp. JGI-2019a]|nr:Mitochondrial matrix cochaperone [Tulasnella sp. JGI-2019a]KAG9015091.1 Mitochondrial matrix cochaperone [Tulasnella sp. JGI-2019a]KAG9030172.1 Mitochondrial matrix cochaperone [Tulasnella sp. JGI-2019a]
MSASLSTATRVFRIASSSSRARLLTAPRASGSFFGSIGPRAYSATATDATNGATASSSSGDAGAEADVKSKIAAKDEEIADLTSRLRYAQADFVNLQKISAREKEQTASYAISNLARDLITTVDVLSLALKSVPETVLKATPKDASSIPHLKQLHDGVTMTHRQLLQTLAKFGVTPFDPTGEPFDPNHHEALYEAPVPGKEPGSVIECSKLGYKIKERTLRAAQVGVAR